jgi:hypothetical protein
MTDETRAFIAERGGLVFVRASQRNCCGGALVLLDTTTDVPADATAFTLYPAANVDVYYLGNPQGVPDELLIEVRGRRRPHLAAYKNGCAYPT